MVGATRLELAFTPWDVPQVRLWYFIETKTTTKWSVLNMVGATRLELATSASQTPRATNCATPRYC